MSWLLMGSNDFSVTMIRHMYRAYRPTDRRCAFMCSNRKNRGSTKNTAMREKSIDIAEAIAVSKTVPPVEGIPTLFKIGMATILNSTAAHAMMIEKIVMHR